MGMTPEQIEIYRAMSPATKLELAAEFNRAARELKEAALRVQHPEWGPEQLREHVKEHFLYGAN